MTGEKATWPTSVPLSIATSEIVNASVARNLAMISVSVWSLYSTPANAHAVGDGGVITFLFLSYQHRSEHSRFPLLRVKTGIREKAGK